MSALSSAGGAGRAAPAWSGAALAILPVAVAAWRFAGITRNYFFGDDLYGFYQIATLGFVEHLVAPYAGHSLVTRNLLLQLMARLFGTDPAPYFWLAFATHIANVALLFAVIRAFSGSAPLASFGALLCGSSPIDEAALGWFAVYGQVLGVTAVLWVLLDLARIAGGKTMGRAAGLRWILLAVAASTSFGTGIGFAFALPLAAVVLIPPMRPRWRAAGWLALGAIVVLVLYVVLAEHAATLPRERRPGLAPFLAGLAYPLELAHLVISLAAFGAQSLVLCGFDPLFSYPGAVPLVAVLAASAVIAAGFAVASGSERRVLVACLLLAAACYGVIAAGRILFVLHAGTSVTVARYQYAGPVPLAIALSVAVGALARTPRTRVRAAAAGIAYVLASQASLRRPVDNHHIYRLNTERTLAALREKIRAAAPGDVYVENGPFTGIGPLLSRNPRMFPALAGAFVIFFPENAFDGRRVFFVEPRWRVIRAAKGKRRIEALLVHDPPDGKDVISVPEPSSSSG